MINFKVISDRYIVGLYILYTFQPDGHFEIYKLAFSIGLFTAISSAEDCRHSLGFRAQT
jgi:hypothetical protein